jgi:hypothetical protein
MKRVCSVWKEKLFTSQRFDHRSGQAAFKQKPETENKNIISEIEFETHLTLNSLLLTEEFSFKRKITLLSICS